MKTEVFIEVSGGKEIHFASEEDLETQKATMMKAIREDVIYVGHDQGIIIVPTKQIVYIKIISSVDKTE